jgi:orotidine-5'-phosphate decarboxylase
MHPFHEKLQQRWPHSLLCVGLDPDWKKMPEPIRAMRGKTVKKVYEFLTRIIDATHGEVCAFKLNTAFYMAFRPDGLRLLDWVVQYIRRHYPGIPIIMDAKDADIGNTNAGYIKAYIEGRIAVFDAITIPPYMGGESLRPFFEHAETYFFVLCKTSNPGSGEFQDEKLESGRLLYEQVAFNATRHWSKHDNIGLMVGATYPEELQRVRAIAPNVIFLVPGMGAQGGEPEKMVPAAVDAENQGVVINAGRSVLYPSDGPDYPERSLAAAADHRRAINLGKAARV